MHVMNEHRHIVITPEVFYSVSKTKTGVGPVFNESLVELLISLRSPPEPYDCIQSYKIDCIVLFEQSNYAAKEFFINPSRGVSYKVSFKQLFQDIKSSKLKHIEFQGFVCSVNTDDKIIKKSLQFISNRLTKTAEEQPQFISSLKEKFNITSGNQLLFISNKQSFLSQVKQYPCIPCCNAGEIEPDDSKKISWVKIYCTY